MLDAVSDLDTSRDETDWATVMRERVLAAREVLLRHPWAPEVIESRQAMIPAVVLYYEGVLAILRQAGSPTTSPTMRSMPWATGSRLQPGLFEPDIPEGDEANEETFRQLAEQLPNLVGMLSSVSHDAEDATLGWCDDQTEFEFGLDVLLDGLELARSRRDR